MKMNENKKYYIRPFRNSGSKVLTTETKISEGDVYGGIYIPKDKDLKWILKVQQRKLRESRGYEHETDYHKKLIAQIKDAIKQGLK